MNPHLLHPTRISDEPTSVLDVREESIAPLRQFSPEATAMSKDLNEARQLIRTELNVKTLNGGQLISELVDSVRLLTSYRETL
jgi:hypothetical protein